MTEADILKMIEHLSYFGYAVNQPDGVEGCYVAEHPRRPDLYLAPFSRGVLLLCRCIPGVSTVTEERLEFLEFVNRVNMVAEVASLHLRPAEDGTYTLYARALLPPVYERSVWAELLDLLWREMDFVHSNAPKLASAGHAQESKADDTDDAALRGTGPVSRRQRRRLPK